MYRVIVLCLILSGCTTTLPRQDNFPNPPALVMRPAKPLKMLPGKGRVNPQDLMKTVAENYGVCRENAVTLSTLQEWVREQGKVK